MKFTRVALTACALGLVGLSPLHAEDTAPKNPPSRGRMMMSPEERVAAIDKAVGGLSEDQKKQITEILTKIREQMQGLSPEERREKGRELMMASGAQIRAVLTPDQQKKYDEMPRPGRGGPAGGGDGHGAAEHKTAN